jgi:hypothetical protein
MTDQEQYEKQEKQEKAPQQYEKQEKQEKTWDEKYRRDPLSSLGWAGFLIWVGLVLLADNLGWLQQTGPFAELDAFYWILAGGGLLLLAIAAARAVMPEYRGPVIGNVILGLLLLSFSVQSLIAWDFVWPLIIIGFGVLLLFRALVRR